MPGPSERAAPASLWLGVAVFVTALAAATGSAQEQPLGTYGEPTTHWTADTPAGHGGGPVTKEMLRSAASATQHWLHYHGDYRGYRHSPLKSLNPQSVKRLQPAWLMPTGKPGQFEASPVIYDGVMYVTTPYNRLYALDPRSGEVFWRYDHPQPSDLRVCCGPPNRGVAIWGDRVLMATLDAKLIAFERKTGAIAWTAEIADYRDGYSSTAAPLVVDGLAYIGVGGGEYGIRGFFDAYDIDSGERVWRHYSVPAKGEPGAETWAGNSYEHGGAPTWTTGAYDPETDTLFWTTGNPSPDWNGDLRAGDNLFSDSLLAVDPKTGERKWYFQFTPHDLWDFDGNSHLFLVDVSLNGETVKAIAQPNRNGYLYLLDRVTGRFLRATPYVDQLNWATIDANGRPVVNPAMRPGEEPSDRVCPGSFGGLNGSLTAAYNPELALAFIPTVEACIRYQKGIATFVRGIPFMGGTPIPVDANEGKASSRLSAIDLSTGAERWRTDIRTMSGVLSTAGGVVITGTLDGFALALDAATGEPLWRFRIGSPVRFQPVAWEIDGRPYVAVGGGQLLGTSPWAGGPDIVPEGGVLVVFTLADD